MMRRAAKHIRAADPRLKLVVCLGLGPGLWLFEPVVVGVAGVFLLAAVLSLAAERPLGRDMVRSLAFFVLFWVGIKVGVEWVTGMAWQDAVADGLVLALRLAVLLLLGLGLALSSSARSLGLAVSWLLRPVIGPERGWRIALSLSLMVHFLPLCLSTLAQVKAAYGSRCPHCSLARRVVGIPLAVVRNLGQKTWNQTLAVAGRGLESPQAWAPDFRWSTRDSLYGLGCLALLAGAWLA
jgi:biotin transport system permease protein